MAETHGLTVDNARSSLAATTPIKRIAQPIEVANLVNFLWSDDAVYISGGFYPYAAPTSSNAEAEIFHTVLMADSSQ